jgi:thymidylate synthase (FAD)
MSKIQLVSKTQGVGKYKGLTSEEIVSAISRHGIIKEDGGKLVKYLMMHKHLSPLDMINFTFEIETSRAIGRQILRHASIKFQEHSQRYSDKVEFEEIELRKEHPTNRQSSLEVFNPDFNGIIYAKDAIQLHLKETENLYKSLIEAGVAKECARMILPECTKSTISANGTLRSWLSFLNVRVDNHSQLELQQLALKIGEELEKEMPNVFSQLDWRNGMFM